MPFFLIFDELNLRDHVVFQPERSLLAPYLPKLSLVELILGTEEPHGSIRMQLFALMHLVQYYNYLLEESSTLKVLLLQVPVFKCKKWHFGCGNKKREITFYCQLPPKWYITCLFCSLLFFKPIFGNLFLEPFSPLKCQKSNLAGWWANLHKNYSVLDEMSFI